MIEILSSGLPNVVQDQGRPGHLSLGVSRSGALDAYSLELANIAVGNDARAAGLEISLFPFRLKFRRTTRFCCMGADAPARLDGKPLPPWWVATALAGQELRLELPRAGARAYLAFDGGVDVPEVLGSRSTDLKSGFGGFEGRGLRRGDTLALGQPGAGAGTASGLLPERLLAWRAELDAGCITVAAVPAAEYLAFTPASREAFVQQAFRITADANRMGYRLQGDRLERSAPTELLSHGIVPGTVQVPPAGQVIVQMAEANTCGGYPKMATVIPSDLWKLGQATSGMSVRFRIVDHATATHAFAAYRSAVDGIRRKCLASR